MNAFEDLPIPNHAKPSMVIPDKRGLGVWWIFNSCVYTFPSQGSPKAAASYQFQLLYILIS